MKIKRLGTDHNLHVHPGTLDRGTVFEGLTTKDLYMRVGDTSGRFNAVRLSDGALELLTSQNYRVINSEFVEVE